MTRYLRQALDEFPDDSTYLDIFKQNKKVDEAEDTLKMMFQKKPLREFMI